MKISLNKQDTVLLDYSECPGCHKPFNMTKRKKTEHHIIPIFLKPKTLVKINLCRECHDELNRCYRGQEIAAQKTRITSKDFVEFKENYTKLRGEFFDKKINRGQFGEGLWSNLVSYLEATAKK